MSSRDKVYEGASRKDIDADAAGCAETRMLLTRRAMLGITASLFTVPFLPDAAEAATDPDRRLMIVILRGGMDGLHVAFNKDDKSTLIGYRGKMFEGFDKGKDQTPYVDRYLDLGNSGFMLNPAMPQFRQMFNQGQAAIVHAIAPPLRTRSHFDCMANLENGQPGLGNDTRDGWLNRCVAGLTSTAPAARALSLGGGPVILQGDAGFDAWTGVPFADFGDAFADAVVKSYTNTLLSRDTNGLFKRFGTNLRRGLDVNKLAVSGQVQRGTDLISSFAGAATLMGQPKGPRIAVITVDGLDTHDKQIEVLDRRLKALDDALAAFKARLGANWSNTIVACVSEFGRTVRVNAMGTDHGVGTVALLAGGNLNATAAGEWPGLRSLDESRDLRAANDLRSLFKGLLKDHLGVNNPDFLNKVVFPGSTAVRPLTGLVSKVAGGVSLNQLTLDRLKRTA
jgi:uncharacterized protein (DUF1501 family)